MPRGSLLGRLTPTRAKNRLTFAADPAEFIVELLHAACACPQNAFPRYKPDANRRLHPARSRNTQRRQPFPFSWTSRWNGSGIFFLKTRLRNKRDEILDEIFAFKGLRAENYPWRALKRGVGFANYVNASFAANDLTIRGAGFLVT